jgi:hypothetical protein
VIQNAQLHLTFENTSLKSQSSSPFELVVVNVHHSIGVYKNARHGRIVCAVSRAVDPLESNNVNERWSLTLNHKDLVLHFQQSNNLSAGSVFRSVVRQTQQCRG